MPRGATFGYFGVVNSLFGVSELLEERFLHDNGIGLLFGLGVAVFLIWFSIWIIIVLPAQMATARGRDALVWVCISLVGSPLLAILLLIALGDAPDSEN